MKTDLRLYTLPGVARELNLSVSMVDAIKRAMLMNFEEELRDELLRAEPRPDKLDKLHAEIRNFKCHRLGREQIEQMHRWYLDHPDFRYSDVFPRRKRPSTSDAAATREPQCIGAGHPN
jgi:hypothetical protein